MVDYLSNVDTATNHTSFEQLSEHPNAAVAQVLWATEGAPAVWSDPAQPDSWAELGTAPPRSGSKLVRLRFPPGFEGSLHQTDSIDYVVVTAGTVFAVLPNAEIELEQGEVLVQRGTPHFWANRGEQDAVLVVALVDAVPRRSESLSGGQRATAQVTPSGG